MSLKIKFILASTLALIVTMVIGAGLLHRRLADEHEKRLETRARLLSAFAQSAQDYVDDELRPAVQAHTDALVLEAMAGTYLKRSLFRQINEEAPDYRVREAAVNPLNPQNRATELEEHLIRQFRDDLSPIELTGYAMIDGIESYYCATPMVVKQSCLECHGSPDTAPEQVVQRYGRSSGYGWQEGDVAAVLMVSVPADDLQAEQRATTQNILLGSGVAVVVGAGVLHVLFILLVDRRARRIRAAMNEVAADPTSPRRALDHAHDELGDIAQTFNRTADRLSDSHRELEVAKVAAEAANESKSQFLANMSHEIRTPMTAILGYADMLMDPQLTVSERLNSVNIIRRNGDHLLSLINDVLDLSKIEAGQMRVERIACDPCAVAAEVASLMRVRAGEKRLGFQVEVRSPVPRSIRSDPLRLKQVLINLVGNAIKFTHSGHVRLELRLEKDGACPMLRFDVVDTGIGISPDRMTLVFQPFCQGDESTTRRFGGTGLGLTITKRLVEMLGGSIEVESAVGTGTTFRVRVPAGALLGVEMVSSFAESVSTDHRGEAAADPEPALYGRILLAEDGVDNQALIAAYLRKAGAEVVTANDGRAACDLVLDAMRRAEAGESEAGFDLVVLDMQMPELDGYGAATLLRSKGYGGPIVALTAHAMAHDRIKCLQAGCTDYLSKPVKRGTLLTTLAKHLRAAAAPDGAGSASSSPDAPAAQAPQLPGEPIRPEGLDEEFRPFLAMYLSHLPQQVRLIQEALAADDLETLKRVLHGLKGSAGMYGLPPVSEQAKLAETRIKTAAAFDAIVQEVNALVDLVRRVEGYDAKLEALPPAPERTREA